MSALRAAVVRAARRTSAGGPVTRGTRPGDGFAFDRLRGYVDGDDPRRIDWSATARTGTLQTRVYIEETILVLAAIVDSSPSMRLGRRRRLLDAADEAARAWLGAAEPGDRVHDLSLGEPFDLGRALVYALHALPRGSSLLLVTDGLDLAAGESGDELLFRLGRRCDATVLLARDPWIDELPLRGLVRVRDAESGRVGRVFVGPRVRARYRDATQQRDASLRARFARAGWRVGALDEGDGGNAVERAFGLR